MSIHVVGGCYRERCIMPRWQRLFGSGLRSALAIGSTNESTVLSSYIPNDWTADVRATLDPVGVELSEIPVSLGVTFSYTQPFASPDISKVDSKQGSSLAVSGDAILRFGLMEGDAVVEGNRVVFDPQYSSSLDFRGNSSTAKSLALILNKQEFIRYGKEIYSDIDQKGIDSYVETKYPEVAHAILESVGADLLLLKRTPFKVTLYEGETDPFDVPSYWAEEFFRIGVGDIFAAAFTRYWAAEQLSPREASDLASRWVARYAETRSPLRLNVGLDTATVSNCDPGPVRLIGASENFGQKLAMLEAGSMLYNLGSKPSLPSAFYGGAGTASDYSDTALLVFTGGLTDGQNQAIVDEIDIAISKGKRVVVFAEINRESWTKKLPDQCVVTNDIGTAVYRSVMSLNRALAIESPSGVEQ